MAFPTVLMSKFSYWFASTVDSSDNMTIISRPTPLCLPDRVLLPSVFASEPDLINICFFNVKVRLGLASIFNEDENG